MLVFHNKNTWRYKMKKTAGIVALLAMGSMGMSSVTASEWNNYRLTITNATAHQVITPPLIVVHNKKFKLFEIASPASEGLSIQAETGNPAILAGEVKAKRGVYKVITGSDVIVYGNKASYEFKAPKNAKVSLTGMLATTNDAFTAITSKSLPKKSVSYMASTYDAGSEDNNELCIDIPGPPCGGTNAANDNDGEGFITIHNGVHGIGDLNSAHLDWRGATSVISITRMDD